MSKYQVEEEKRGLVDSRTEEDEDEQDGGRAGDDERYNKREDIHRKW